MERTAEKCGERQVLQARRFGRLLPELLLLAAALLGAGLRMGCFETDLARSPDERTYTRQANLVLEHGTEGYRLLGEEYLAQPAVMGAAPSPLRVGYTAPLAAVMRVTGQPNALTAAYVSLLCSLATLLLVALFGWRLFSPTVAIVATLFLAVSPFDLTISRRAWEESYISLLAMAVLWLCVPIAWSQGTRRNAALASFACAGLLCLLTKETVGIAFLACATGLAVQLARQRDHRGAVTVSAAAGAAVLGAAGVLAALFGGFSQTWLLVVDGVRYSGKNLYDLQWDSGPVWMFPAALLRASPFLFVFCLTGFAAALHRARNGRKGGLPLGIALLSFSMLLLQVITRRYSFRYAAFVYGPACLLGGIGAEAALGPLCRWLAPLGRTAAWAILGFAVAVAALHDFNFGYEELLLPRRQDLPLRWVLGVPAATVSPQQIR